MSEYIEVGQPLQFTDPNTPTRVGEIVENVSDIYNIPSPRLGMQVFVKSEKKSYVITSLKSKVINGVNVPEAAVEAFEPVGAKSFTWNNDTDPSNMNDFVVAGVYDIKGERTRTNDNLPILNTGGGHSFNARLTVLDSSISGSGEADDKCITQVLSFSNRLGQGEVYIRTGKGASLNNLIWEKWSTLQRNVNVKEVESLDNLIDNGIYSGVLKKGSMVTDYETFVLVVINDYAIAGEEKRVSQFKYGLDVYGKPSYKSRYSYIPEGYTFPTWTEWEILNKDEINSMIAKAKSELTNYVNSTVADAIKGIIADAPEAFDTLREIADWIANDETGAVALANAISANTAAITAERTRAIGQEGLLNNAIAEEKGRAEQTEQAIEDKIDEEIERSVAADQDLQRGIDTEVRRATEAEGEINQNTIAADSLGYSTTTTDISLEFETLDGISHGSVTIPAATTESAGVMSATDKVALDKATTDIKTNADAIAEEKKRAEKHLAAEVDKIKDGDTIVGQAREIHSRNGKTVPDSFLVRTTAGSGTIGDGVASLKSVGGNIVKNLVDGVLLSGLTITGGTKTVENGIVVFSPSSTEGKSSLRNYPHVSMFLTRIQLFFAEAQLFFDKQSCSCYNATTFYK